MNRKLIFTTLVFICLLILKSHGQTDSSKVNYSEESSDSSDFKYRRVYQYLDINMKNEKRLFKISPGFNFSDVYSALRFQISYEWKIKKQYSVSLNAFTLFTRTKDYNYSYFDNQSYLYSNNSTIGLNFRYYFTLKKRMENGISGNNLNGLYVGLGTHLLSYNQNYNSHYPNNYNPGLQMFFDEFNPSLSIGLQKRLNNWSYFDVFTSAALNDKKLFINLGFNLGLAWGNK